MAAESQVKAVLAVDISQLKEGIDYSIEDLKKLAQQATITSEAMKTKSQAMAEEAKKAATTISEADLKVAEAKKKVAAVTAETAKAFKDLKAGAGEAGDGAIIYAAKLRELRAVTLELTEAEKERAEIEKGFSLGEMHESFMQFAEMFAVVEGVNKLREAVASSLEFGESMSQASKKTGLTVETLSTLHSAADQTHQSFDDMVGAVSKMDKTIGAATEGNKKAASFLSALGLNATELAGRQDGAEVAFRRFAERLAGTENPIRRVELATGLLGKAGAAQIPMLLELAENWDYYTESAKAAGTYLTSDEANALEEMNGKFAQMEMSVKGAALAFTEHFVPSFQKLIGVIGDGQKSFSVVGELGTLMARGLAAAEMAAYGLLSGLAGVGEVMARLAAAGQQNGTSDFFSSLRQEYDRQSQAAREIMLNGAPESPKPKDTPKPAPAFDGIGDSNAAAEANKANEERLKAMKAHVAEWETLAPVTQKAIFDYWEEQKSTFTRGSEQFQQIVEMQAAIARGGAAKVHEAFAKLGKREEGLDQEAGLLPDYSKPLQNAKDGVMATDGITHASGAWDGYKAAVAKAGEIQAQTTAAMAEADIKAKEVAGHMSPLAAAVELAKIHSKEFADELEHLNNELADLENKAKRNAAGDFADPKEAQRIQELKNQIAQLTDKGITQKGTDQKAIAEQITKPYLDAFHQISQEFNRTVLSILNGQERIGRGAKKLALAEADYAVEAGLQWVEKKAASYLKDEVLHLASTLRKKAADATAQTTQVATTSAANVASASSYAAVAAAGALAATAAIPFVGPAMAPGVASGILAVGEGFAGMAAFELGTPYVPRTGIAMLHKGEAVLGSPSAEALRSRLASPEPSGGGDTHIHVDASGAQFYGDSAHEFGRKFDQHLARKLPGAVDTAYRGTPIGRMTKRLR